MPLTERFVVSHCRLPSAMRFCSLESDRQMIRYAKLRKKEMPISSCWSNPTSWTPEIQGWRT